MQADGQTPLEVAMRDLSRVAQKGAAAVVITPNGSEAWLPELVTLAQAGVQSHVTILDRPSFGGASSSEGLSSSVRQLGFTASIIEQGAVGEPLHEQERRGFWEFKVTGLGKAVATRRPR